MLVIMKSDANEEQVTAVIHEIERLGFRGIPIPGAQRTAVCVVGNKGTVDEFRLQSLPGVKETIRVTKPYKLVSRETRPQSSKITVGEITNSPMDGLMAHRFSAAEHSSQELHPIASRD